MSNLSPEALAGLQALAAKINAYLPPHRSLLELMGDLETVDTEDPPETVPIEVTTRELIVMRLAIDIALMIRAIEASPPSDAPH